MLQTYTYDINKIDKPELLEKVISAYTGMYYTLYNNFELSVDSFFIKETMQKFDLTKNIYDNCIKDVKMQFDKDIYKKQNNEKLILELEAEIEKINNKDRQTKFEKRKRLKLEKRLRNTKKNLNKKICFGGKLLLRNITKLSQLKQLTDKQNQILERTKKEYKNARKRNIFLQGRGCEQGNRNIEFHLDEGYVIFKFNKKIHIRLDLKPFDGNNRTELIARLQQAIEENWMPVTVRLSNKYLHLNVDVEKLNGFAFDETRLNNLKKEHPLTDKKTLWKQVKDEQTEKKLSSKIRNRVAGIDMNPDEIGFSISDVDPITNEVSKVIFTRRYDLRQLSEAKPKKKSKKQWIRNKQKYEIKEIYNEIFAWCTHYKVAYFGVEELNFGNISDNSTEFNRKTKNIWYRGIQESMINIKVAGLGIMMEEICPIYTSFIGSWMFPQYHDCIGASIEIGRRAFTKYLKNCPNRLYPSMEKHIHERLSHLAIVPVPMKSTWVSLYRECKLACYGAEGWWRNKTSTVGKNLFSKKAMVNYHCF